MANRTALTWSAAVSQSKLKPSAKLVLIAIGLRMNAHGEGAFPSIKTIASDCGVCERTVERSISRGVDAGFLEIEGRCLPNGGRTSNLYRAVWPQENVASTIPPGDTPVAPPLATHLSPPGDTPVAPISFNYPINNTPPPPPAGGMPGSEDPVPLDEEPFQYEVDPKEFNLAPKVISPPLAKPKPRRSKRTASPLKDWQTPLFEKFWKAYWLKAGKDGAERRFAEVVDSEQTFQAIMAAVEAQREMQCAKETPKYAQGWLNERRWMDEVPPKWRKCGESTEESAFDREARLYREKLSNRSAEAGRS